VVSVPAAEYEATLAVLANETPGADAALAGTAPKPMMTAVVRTMPTVPCHGLSR
jgi:hypothetical protein